MKVGTENEHGIGKSAEDGKKEAADDARTENFQQQLASAGEISSSEEHEITIDKDEK